MNKNFFLLASLIVIVAVGVGVYSMNGRNAPSPSMEKPSMAVNEPVTKEVSDSMMQEGDKKKEGGMMKKEDEMMENKGPGEVEKEMKTMEGSTDMMKKEDSAMMKRGSYEAYDSQKVSQAASGKVILFFRAGWCPTCRVLDADIKAHLSDIPENVILLDVDYDKAGDLKQKYGVTYQHTLVQVDAQGNALKKWSGSPTLTSLIGQIQ